jgi:hypothetical protein
MISLAADIVVYVFFAIMVVSLGGLPLMMVAAAFKRKQS